MVLDKYGQIILSESDICDQLLCDPDTVFGDILCYNDITFDPLLGIKNKPNIVKYVESNCTIDEFDDARTNNFKMPEKYQELDIFEFVISKCSSDIELYRSYEELIVYQKYNLLNLLRYLVYLVDTMRQNNIVWGVGRGSSVSSFVLYLIGIHRINSIQYELSFDEFLK